MLGEIKIETTNPQPTQIDEKAKAEIESIYNNLNSLTCLKSIPSILNKIAANEIKFEEMSEWVLKTEQISDLNKEIRDEFENDEAVLNQLEKSFKQNAEKVREAIKKLSEWTLVIQIEMIMKYDKNYEYSTHLTKKSSGYFLLTVFFSRSLAWILLIASKSKLLSHLLMSSKTEV